MNVNHVSGAAVGAVLGAILVACLHRYGIAAISDSQAALIGAGTAAAGVGVAHALWTVGLLPIIHRILHGPPKPDASEQPQPQPTPSPAGLG